MKTPIEVNTRPEFLKDWQAMFKRIFGERNKEFYTPAECLLHILEETRGIAKSLRREEDAEEMTERLATIFGWLVAVLNYLEIDMEDALWFKYPGICPYCFAKKNCFCISNEHKYDPDEVNLNHSRRDTKRMPRSLSKQQKLFKEIYGKVNAIMMRQQIWNHFMEELGEMSYELRHKNKQQLKEESADVLAWLIAFCIRIDVDLDEIVWHTYHGECNVCAKDVCECPYV